jgi:gliding motility-associated-like protein
MKSLAMKFLGITSALLTAAVSQAQIENGSFELNYAIPQHLGEYHLVKAWNNAGSNLPSVDYYYRTAPEACNWPETPYAMVEAKNGNAMVGLALTGKSQENERAYLQTKFTEPLIVGDRYRIRLFVTNGVPTEVSTAGLATSDLGFYFSQSAWSQNLNFPLVAQPQYKIAEVVYSEDWKQIDFEIIPTEPFNYLTIGVFGPDPGKTIEQRAGHSPEVAYYFFDQFTITHYNNDLIPDDQVSDKGEPVKPATEVFIPNSFSPNGDGKNDIFQPEMNGATLTNLSIYSRWGELIYSSKGNGAYWDGSDGKSQVPMGTYYWKMEYSVFEKGTTNYKNQEGFVTLIR